MKTYMIRTCAPDMKSFNDFTWPESGDVTCPDWDPKPHCGNGLHGLLLGCGRGDLLDWSDNAKWLIVEIDREDIVDLDGKIKVPKGTVIYCGVLEEAIAKLEALAPETLAMPVVGATRTAGDNGTATVGFRGKVIAGDEGIATASNHGFATAGWGGKATAGFHGTAIAGDCGKAIAGNDGIAMAGYNGTATAGSYGSATAGNDGIATVGAYGIAVAGDRGSATAGVKGTAQVGEDGGILIKWYDTKANRMRTVTGYVGEDGIEADKPYRVDPDTGKLVLAE